MNIASPILHSNSLFEDLYSIEWSQQLFPYYNIQSLDIIQMSRMPEDLAAYQAALPPLGTPDRHISSPAIGN